MKDPDKILTDDQYSKWIDYYYGPPPDFSVKELNIGELFKYYKSDDRPAVINFDNKQWYVGVAEKIKNNRIENKRNFLK